MSKKRDISREEIAKQFLLPERQSKIDTLLKQDGQAYCICRSSDSSRFMIACDACEEWYHGDCIQISEKEAKLIKQYFCIRCTEEDSTLQTRWKTKRDENAMKEEHRSKKRKERNENKPDKKQKRCGDCMGCYRTEDCERCDVCTRKHKYGRQKERCKQRVCINYGNRRKRKDSGSDIEITSNAHLQTDSPRQCYGPACTNSARFGSKYCSDACGNRLATTRIYQVLPHLRDSARNTRIQEWALSPCVAEETNIKSLEEIRKQQFEVQQILQELDKRHRELDMIVERARHAIIDPNAEYEHEEESEMSMYCITCGHEIIRTPSTNTKKNPKCQCIVSLAVTKYIRKLPSNIWRNVSINTNLKPHSDRTYCKRLRVLCPEHCKDPKIGENEVCGCPLVTNVFDLTGEFCRAPKKSCTKHYVWEKLRRAEIDLERVRQWLKMDELLEKERQIRQSMASRAGVLALMLHSTYNHEVMEEITKASQKDQDAMQKELAKRFRKGAKHRLP
ncbi:CXXC zinc finger domain [Popillia japonica]|uniref:CXXC-type zinc finger protein 1 n=1 Tax=Popillia japonica TaxID=7064 RepID=A0AAW1KN38_POPJA